MSAGELTMRWLHDEACWVRTRGAPEVPPAPQPPSCAAMPYSSKRAKAEAMRRWRAKQKSTAAGRAKLFAKENIA